MTTATAPRPISEIAADIIRDWKSPYFGAVPYIQAMRGLDTMTSRYGEDPAAEIVMRFLVNARTWRGPVAKSVKAELKGMM